MAVTQVDLDDAALAEVMRLAGVHTKKEAVNLALRDYVERFRRAEALARSRERAQRWDHDGWVQVRADEKRFVIDPLPGRFVRGVAATASA